MISLFLFLCTTSSTTSPFSFSLLLPLSPLSSTMIQRRIVVLFLFILVAAILHYYTFRQGRFSIPLFKECSCNKITEPPPTAIPPSIEESPSAPDLLPPRLPPPRRRTAPDLLKRHRERVSLKKEPLVPFQVSSNTSCMLENGRSSPCVSPTSIRCQLFSPLAAQEALPPHRAKELRIGSRLASPRCAPGLIIIGFAKTGTSSLAHMLARHPQMRLARSEMHHFDALYHRHGTEEITHQTWQSYFAKFSSVHELPGHRGYAAQMAGEKTPAFAPYSRLAPMMKQRLPHVKLIICIRHPFDRLISHYYFRIKQTKEGIARHPFLNTTLDTILRDELNTLRRCAEDERKIFPLNATTWLEDCLRASPLLGLTLPYHDRPLALSLYSEWLRSWMSVFSPSQLFIWYNGPRESERLQELFNWLGIVDIPNELRELPKSNTGIKPTELPLSPELVAEVRSFLQPYDKELEQLIGFPVPWRWD